MPVLTEIIYFTMYENWKQQQQLRCLFQTKLILESTSIQLIENKTIIEKQIAKIWMAGLDWTILTNLYTPDDGNWLELA